MANTYRKRALGGGVNMLEVSEKRFKLSSVAISLLLPLEKSSVSARALVPYILKTSCSLFTDACETRRRLAMMYGAELTVSSDRLGDCQQITLNVAALDDRYTIGGEKLSGQCARLLCDVLLRPKTDGEAFRKEDVDREKRLLIEQIEAEKNNKLRYSLERCISEACAGEPFGINALGVPSEISALSPAEIYSAYRELLRTAKIDIVAIGMLDFDGIADMFGHELSAIERCPAPIPDAIVKSAGQGKSVTEYAPVTQTNMIQLLRLSPDISREAGRMTAVCLGGSVSSLLFKHIREEMSLCYYCSSIYDRSKHVMLIYSGLQDSNLDKAIEAINGQISVITDGDLTAEELEAARLSVNETYRQVYDSIGAVTSWYLGRVLEETPETPEQTAEAMNTVSAEEIRNAARSLSHDLTFMLRPAADGQKTEEDE